jgi:glutathione S-transferase
VLAELGVAHERVQMSIEAGDTRKADFLKLNPNGRVPVIVHDGVTIWESAAITLYLGETFGVEAGLFPPPSPQRGAAMKWVVWANMALAEAGGRLSAAQPDGTDGGTQENSRDWLPPEQRTTAMLEKARVDIAACLNILEAELSDKDFLLGSYSLVDTHLQAFVGWLTMLEVSLSATPYVAAWLERCNARPALKALMEG